MTPNGKGGVAYWYVVDAAGQPVLVAGSLVTGAVVFTDDEGLLQDRFIDMMRALRDWLRNQGLPTAGVGWEVQAFEPGEYALPTGASYPAVPARLRTVSL